MSKTLKRPRDTNQFAAFIVGVVIGTGQLTEKETDEKNSDPVPLRRLGGQKGGKARVKSITAERRSEITKKAAKSLREKAGQKRKRQEFEARELA
jgi:hypothetical protein